MPMTIAAELPSCATPAAFESGALVVAAAVGDEEDVEVMSPNVTDPDDVSVVVDGRLAVREIVAEL